MKKNVSKRVLSTLLAVVMVFLMIPFSAVTIYAVEAEVFAGEGDYIGKSYNALGGSTFGEDALTLTDIFINRDVLDFETRPKNETNCTYALVDDFYSYAYNQSKALDASIDVGAKIKIVKLNASVKYGMSSSSSFSGEQHSEYFVMEVTHVKNTSYMNVTDSMLKGLWDADQVINPEFTAAINTMKPEDFFAQYGTHIITGYSAGGYSYASYQGESLVTNASSSDSRNTSVGVGADVGPFVSLKGEMKISESNNSNTSTSSNTVLSGRATIGGDGSILDLSKDGIENADVNNYIQSITEENARIILDNNLKMLSVWDFIYASGDDSLYDAAQALEEYYYEHIDSEEEPIGGHSDDFLDYSDCKIITTPQEFYNIRNNLDGNYVLACNIDLSAYENWEPIGSKLDPFTGRFYGNSNTISGLNITSCTDNIAGLFGYNYGTIHGVRVEGSISLDGASSVGAIAAYNYGTISDCYDAVVYDVDYFSLTDVNLGLRKIDLETISSAAISSATIKVGDENGIHLVGRPGKIYTGINIVIDDKGVESPAYIILENVNIVGDSEDGTIYNPATRPLYLISLGTSNANAIKGTINAPGINTPYSELHIFGTAELAVSGGEGEVGVSKDEYGVSGSDGKDGGHGIIANEVYATINEFTVMGGTGGNGGNGGSHADGADGKNGGNAIVANEVYATINEFTVIGGNGGNGGLAGFYGHGGDAGNGGHGIVANKIYATINECNVTGGNGGNGMNGDGNDIFGRTYGGDAGNGGDAISCSVITLHSEIATLTGGNGGNGGNGPSYGGNAGNGGYAVSPYADKNISSSKVILVGGNAGVEGGGMYSNGASGANASPKADIYIENKRYVLYDTTKTWIDAKSSAESNGVYLATITSESEQGIINELISYGNLNDYYIGARRAEDDVNAWEWMTGEPFSYAIWASGEPNNNNNQEDYLGIFKDQLAWNDYPDAAHGYIEEYDLSFDENPIEGFKDRIAGITVGHSNSSDLSAINRSAWSKVTLSIASVAIDPVYGTGKVYYSSGDEFDKSTVCVSANGEEVYYDYSFNSQRIGINFVRITDGFCTRLIPVYVEEIPPNAPCITVDNKNAVIGSTATVKLSLKNNPGITSMRIKVSYDSALLTLENVEYNSAMGGQSVQPENYETLNGSVILYWVDGFANYEGDDVFATLKFSVSDNAVAGASTMISVTYDAEDIYDADDKNVTFFCDDGAITFIDYIPGDINGDGILNTKDTTSLMKYHAGWDIEVNEAALDVNGDGDINTRDTTHLMKYLAGWNVEIY